MSKLIRRLVVLMLMTACAHAANLTVCQNGCDHSNIQAAIYAAKNNDTIELHSGTYNESAILTKELKFVGKDTGSGEPLVMGDLYTYGYRYSLRGFGFNQIKIHPSSYPEVTDSVYYWLGKERDYYSAKSYAKALDAISKALKLDPQNAVAWNLKGLCLDAQGRNDEAMECYDNAIKIDPSGSNQLGNKGHVLYILGDYEKANYYYDQAINADPRHIGYLSMKALVLSKMAKFDDALKTIDKAIGLQPQNADYWSTKSVILFNRGKFDDALTAVDKSIDLNPSQNLFWQIKGNILQTMGRNTEADASFAKAKELGYQG
jgi:tetratricopeptide (TPR) repeat protein